jgi:hypothetical protein
MVLVEEDSAVLEAKIRMIHGVDYSTLEDFEDKLLAIIVLIVALQAHAHKLVKVFP